MRYIVNFVILIGWISGVVIAKGFWSTLFAVFIPFWAWYLVVEMYLIK
jgi:hypothetical protein